jgi:hypothetical protein
MHARAEFGVEGAHRLRPGVDDGDRQPAPDQRLGHLDADVTGANHHRAPRPAVELGLDRRGVLEVLHAQHARRVHAGQVRAHRARPGGDHQVVETDPPGGPAVQIPHRDLAPVPVDALDKMTHSQIDAVGAVLVGAAGDQLGPISHVAGDPVRDAAGGVGAERTAVEGDHLHVLPAHPLDGGGRAHAGPVRPDHHDAGRHVSILPRAVQRRAGAPTRASRSPRRRPR